MTGPRVTRYQTRNSTYEVDSLGKRVRRTAGVNPPTEHQGPDGEWREYKSLERTYWGGLLIHWTDPGKVTVTSEVTKVEPDAQSE